MTSRMGPVRRQDPTSGARPLGTGAFSLIELLVALSLTAMIVALALGVFVQSREVDRVRALRSELIREGAFASTILTNTLRRAGSGIPTGAHIDDATRAFESNLIWGDDDVVGIVADLERPDAPYATLGYLHGKAPTGSSSERKARLMWHTENNGRCVATDPATCDVGDASVFFPGEAGCDSSGTTELNDRTCPWGLKRLRGGESFLIAAAGRDWTDAVFTPSGSGLVFAGGPLYLELAAPYTDALDSWANDDDTPPMEVTGLGFVSTPDRVFFRFEGAGPYELQRKQCWGEAHPDDADWPSSAAGSFPGALQTGVTGQTCHPAGDAAWEPLLKNIESFALTYFDVTGAALGSRPLSAADRAAAVRVDYRITLSRTDGPSGRVVHYDLVGSAASRNRR